MTDAKRALSRVGVAVPEVLLPVPGTDLHTWAVVACDQYTSEPAYWQRVCQRVADAPSTYHLILPEIDLPADAARIVDIHGAMRRYVAEGVLAPAREGFVLVDRQTEAGHRLGLVLAVDLEQYDFSPGATSLIRPTEGTVAERIPPRVAIRQDAPLECPHVMLLVDDPGRTLIEPLYAVRDALPPLYDTPLMEGGGHLTGWAVTEPARVAQVARALEGLNAQSDGLLFAVGDGNHSLATARQCWLNLKKSLPPERQGAHPARFALVEVVNLHDNALRFEGIHRALFGVSPEDVRAAWQAFCDAQGLGLVHRAARAGEQGCVMLLAGRDAPFTLTAPKDALPLMPLQDFLDDYVRRHPGARIDYIHGEASLRTLVGAPDAAGFLLPGFDKAALFPAVRQRGALPRKTFSMGEAHEKRYYMECREIAR